MYKKMEFSIKDFFSKCENSREYGVNIVKYSRNVCITLSNIYDGAFLRNLLTANSSELSSQKKAPS